MFLLGGRLRETACSVINRTPFDRLRYDKKKPQLKHDPVSVGGGGCTMLNKMETGVLLD